MNKGFEVGNSMCEVGGKSSFAWKIQYEEESNGRLVEM